MPKPRFSVVPPGVDARRQAKLRRQLGERLELLHLRKDSPLSREREEPLWLGVLQLLALFAGLAVFTLAVAAWLSP